MAKSSDKFHELEAHTDAMKFLSRSNTSAKLGDCTMTMLIFQKTDPSREKPTSEKECILRLPRDKESYR